MPTIPNFPQALADLHHHWHVPWEHPEAGPGRVNAMGTPGGGLEFLTFHRNYDAQFLAWYNSTSFTQAPFNDPVQKADLVQAWTSVPPELQADDDWPAWSDEATRLDTGTPDFASVDDLGTYIETGIHNMFLHGATAEQFGESIVGGFHSPQSTLFYKIHGLVDHWWSLWQLRHKIRIKEIKEFVKEIQREVAKPRIREVFKERIPEVKDRIGEVKFAALEAFEDERVFDPVINPAVEERLGRVERRVFPKAATVFITGEMRPDVGGQVTGSAETEHGHNA